MSPFDLESPAFFTDPGPTLAKLREAAPVYFHEPLGAWILTAHDDVALALRDSRFSVDRGGAIARCPHPGVRAPLDECNQAFGAWMVFSDAPLHLRLRDRAAPGFTPARVRRLRASIEAFAGELASAMVGGSEARDLVASFTDPLPARVTAALLGIPSDDIGALEAHTDHFFAFFGATTASAEVVTRAHESLLAMRAYFDEQLERRRREVTDDLLSYFLSEEEARASLSHEELVGLAMTLVAGAFGTTTHLIGHAVLALLERRSEWEKLVRDPSLAASAVEETMRFDGPALSVQRRALVDVELKGSVLRAGDRVYAMLHAANHDPAVFPDPGRFDIGRPTGRHLGFGMGAHFCLGASLSRLEATIALATLVERFPELELAGAPRRVGTIAMRGLASLPVRLGARGGGPS